MYDQFDEKLSNRIKNVFENFEDDTANLGWQELRKRLPEQKRKQFALWWQAAAAVLVLTLGTWIYTTSSTKKIYLTGKNNLETLESDSLVNDNVMATADALSKRQNSAPANLFTSTSTNNRALLAASKRFDTHKLNGHIDKTTVFSHSNITVLSVLPEDAKDEAVDSAFVLSEQQNLAAKALAGGSAATVKALDRDAFENLVIGEMIQKKATADSKSTTANTLTTTSETKKAESKKSKQLSLSLFAGSYFNYANGSESSVNSGAGISSEINLTNKLKLATGISIAQNTLKYSGSIPQSAAADFISIASTNENLFQDAVNSGSVFSTTAATYSINNYNVSLLGLDIPLNLKYTLLQHKTDLYIVAGFSSNLYIDESYTYSYQVNSALGSSVSKQADNRATARLQNFDFARMFNFSLGLGRALGKQSRVSLEPFVKYPLAGQGARDLRFGAAGMNIKLNLNNPGIRN